MCAMFRNASHFPSEGSLGGLISGLSGALRQVGDAAASVLGGRGVRMDEDGQGPFEAAVQAAAGSGNDTDAMMAALSKHSVRLTPLIKRRVFPDLPGVPRGVALGWAQLTSGEGATVSIGLFIGHDRFSQIVLADGNGRVFVTSDPHADTHDMKPRFMLVKEEELDAVVCGDGGLDRRVGGHGPRVSGRHRGTGRHRAHDMACLVAEDGKPVHPGADALPAARLAAAASGVP